MGDPLPIFILISSYFKYKEARARWRATILQEQEAKLTSMHFLLATLLEVSISRFKNFLSA